jgi:hypothetical protein
MSKEKKYTVHRSTCIYNVSADGEHYCGLRGYQEDPVESGYYYQTGEQELLACKDCTYYITR